MATERVRALAAASPPVAVAVALAPVAAALAALVR